MKKKTTVTTTMMMMMMTVTSCRNLGIKCLLALEHILFIALFLDNGNNVFFCFCFTLIEPVLLCLAVLI